MDNHYSSRKIRRIKYLVKKLARTKRYSVSFKRLVVKIQSLANDLTRVLSFEKLTKVLGGAALFITMSSPSLDAQTFAAPVVKAYGMGVGALDVVCPSMGDLDGDGDYDMIVGHSYGAIQYQRNSGSATNPVFDAPLNGPFGLVDTASWGFPHLVDIDNDGDLDLFSGEYENPARFVYFENVGSPTNPNFAAPKVNPFNLVNVNYLSSPNFADIDGDGDLDLFSINTFAIKYFENTGSASNPNFAAPVNNPNGIFFPVDVYFYNVDVVDIDMDGDYDLIMNEYYGDFYYFQNTGTPTSPNFAAPVTNPFNLSSTGNPPAEYIGCVESVDIDGDGDYDLVLGRYDDLYYETVLYYENLAVSTQNENLLAAVMVTISPNPATSFLLVTADIEEAVNATLFDSSGKSVVLETNVSVQHGHRIDIDQLPNGQYVLNLETEDGRLTSKQVSIIR